MDTTGWEREAGADRRMADLYDTMLAAAQQGLVWLGAKGMADGHVGPGDVATVQYAAFMLGFAVAARLAMEDPRSLQELRLAVIRASPSDTLDDPEFTVGLHRGWAGPQGSAGRYDA